MTDKTLGNCHILVVEDEYMLAEDLQAELEGEGAIVVGPVGSLGDTIDLIRSQQHIDGAILDANLGGEMVFAAADLLMERQIPIVFTTGYDASMIPDRFGHITRCEKPVDMKKVTKAIGRAIHI